jgi:hypothetical protein
MTAQLPVPNGHTRHPDSLACTASTDAAKPQPRPVPAPIAGPGPLLVADGPPPAPRAAQIDDVAAHVQQQTLQCTGLGHMLGVRQADERQRGPLR